VGGARRACRSHPVHREANREGHGCRGPDYADAAQAAGSGVASAGKATGGVVKTGAVGIGKGAKATPGLAVRGTKAVAKGLAKAIW